MVIWNDGGSVSFSGEKGRGTTDTATHLYSMCYTVAQHERRTEKEMADRLGHILKLHAICLVDPITSLQLVASPD